MLDRTPQIHVGSVIRATDHDSVTSSVSQSDGDVFADFEAARTDGGTDGGDQVRGILGGKGSHGLAYDTGDHASPAGMDGSDCTGVSIGEQHWYAIRDAHAEGEAGFASDQCIRVTGADFLGLFAAVESDHRGAVHLVDGKQPVWLVADGAGQATVIFFYSGRVVSYAPAEIEGGERPIADASCTGTESVGESRGSEALGAQDRDVGHGEVDYSRRGASPRLGA